MISINLKKNDILSKKCIDIINNSTITKVGIDLSYINTNSSSKSTTSDAKSSYDTGKEYYDKGKEYSNAVAHLMAPTLSEQHYAGDYWDPNSVLKGDKSFEDLKSILNEQAKIPQSTRDARYEDMHNRIKEATDYVPVFGYVFLAAYDAIAAISKFFQGKNDPDSKAEYDRVHDSVKGLWDTWRMIPSYQCNFDVITAHSCANKITLDNHNMNQTEPGLADKDPGYPWREKFISYMNIASNPDAPPAIKDLILNKWLPLKDGTIDDKSAATMGVLVAANEGVKIEPVVEAAILSARSSQVKYTTPQFGMKIVFLATVQAANKEKQKELEAVSSQQSFFKVSLLGILVAVAWMLLK